MLNEIAATYSSVNDLPGVFKPVDSIRIACSNLGVLFSHPAPLLLDVSELVVGMKHYNIIVSSYIPRCNDDALTQREYIYIRVVELGIVLVQLVEASLERRVKYRILRVFQLLLPLRAQRLECGDHAMKCGYVV